MGQGNAIEAPATEELLSQFAGDEIDRLLAEAEKESLPPTNAPKTVAEAAPSVPGHKVISPNASPPTGLAAGGVALAPSEGINTSATTLAELFKNLPDSEPLTAVTSPTPVVLADAAFSQAPVSAAATPAIMPLPSAPPPKSVAVDVALPEEDPSLAAVPAREPLLIQFLEKLNSPLDNVDDLTRQRIGYIAIVTLFNAMAVLAYVHFAHRR